MNLRSVDMKYPFEIRDPHIDMDVIMARIHENLAERRLVAFDPAALAMFEVGAGTIIGDAALDYHLGQAHATYDKVWPDLSLAPSWATQLPVVGRLWRMVREQAHRLVLYYVDMAVSRQIGFNEHVVGSLDRLATLQEKVAALQQEVTALKRQVAEMQAEQRRE